jgi:hypothetical protein
LRYHSARNEMERRESGIDDIAKASLPAKTLTVTTPTSNHHPEDAHLFSGAISNSYDLLSIFPLLSSAFFCRSNTPLPFTHPIFSYFLPSSYNLLQINSLNSSRSADDRTNCHSSLDAGALVRGTSLIVKKWRAVENVRAGKNPESWPSAILSHVPSGIC